MSRGTLLFALSMIGGFHSMARCEVGINTLRGIDQVKILIEDLQADSLTDGVSEGALQTQAETALKQLGLKVTERAGVPVLYVSLSTERADGVLSFALRLELLQGVTLARDAAIQASSATTWSTFRFGRVGERGYANKVRSIFTILLQSFQDDFLAVNPRVWPPQNPAQTISSAASSESSHSAK